MDQFELGEAEVREGPPAQRRERAAGDVAPARRLGGPVAHLARAGLSPL